MTKGQEDQVITSLPKLKGRDGQVLLVTSLFKLIGRDDHMCLTSLLKLNGLRWPGLCYHFIEAEGSR